MMLTRRLVGAAAPLALVLTAACAPAAPDVGPAAEAVAITPELIAEGRQVFTSAGRCGVCHGTTARGGSLGPNLTDEEWIWIDTDANIHTQLVAIIRNGIPEPRQFPSPMPAMGGARLTEQQINAVAAYVGSL